MDKEGCFVAIIIALVIVLIFAAIFAGDAWICSQKTAHIGFPHKYMIPGGCMIEPEPGMWIPLENWRLFED